MYRDAARQQELDLVSEREAAENRLKALEEQVKAGRLRKQEEKRRKQAAAKDDKEKEAKLAAQRAELEAARERERQLQMQLESLDDDDSSDDENLHEATPQDNTPTNSQFLIPHATSSTTSASASTSLLSSTVSDQVASAASPPIASTLPATHLSSHSSETKNPFFKKLSQSGESSTVPVPRPAASIASSCRSALYECH